MDDAMRERATSQDVFEALQRVIIGGIKATVVAHGTSAESSWISSASKRIAKDVQHNFLADFASSEADRREQECIEAVCLRCDHGHTPRRTTIPPGDWIWVHDNVISHDISWNQKRCRAECLHELRYQRQQREKGEGHGR